MLYRHPVSTDKNAQRNFDALFNHVNRYYLGSMTASEVSRLDADTLPYGAMVYNRTNHALCVLTSVNNEKMFKPITLS